MVDVAAIIAKMAMRAMAKGGMLLLLLSLPARGASGDEEGVGSRSDDGCVGEAPFGPTEADGCIDAGTMVKVMEELIWTPMGQLAGYGVGVGKSVG